MKVACFLFAELVERSRGSAFKLWGLLLVWQRKTPEEVVWVAGRLKPTRGLGLPEGFGMYAGGVEGLEWKDQWEPRAELAAVQMEASRP